MCKISLDPPYSLDWRFGYLVTNGEGRRTIILFNSNEERTSTSYARYLVSVKEGRYLSKEEHVDHIDNDKTNDCLNNLQILSLKENNKKESERRGRLMVEMLCPCCSKKFSRRKGTTFLVNCYKNRLSSCSKECSYSLNSLSDNERLNLLDIQKSNYRLYNYYEEI